MSLKIKRAVVNEVALIAPLFDQYRQFYKQPSELARCAEFLRERIEKEESVVFLALQADQALGFVQLYPGYSSVRLLRSWTLNDLFVSESARGAGVASHLLEAAVVHARETGAGHMSLATAKDNPAGKLYRKLGWLPNETFDHYTFRI
jgi:GNAT superfamily N-acetyltransferase